MWTRELATAEPEDESESAIEAAEGKSSEEVRRHYELLVEDVDGIEVGRVPLLVWGRPSAAAHEGDGLDERSEKLEAARVALGKRKERELLQAQLGPKAELSKPGNNSNKLLAGYLAHEFLAHGTLLGRRIEPTSRPEPEPEPKRRYAELSWLLMANGAHIPGVVNPTQLGRWLQIKE